MINEIKEKTIHDPVYWGEVQSRKKILELYQKASVVVRPDLLGISGGLTTLEALACGTPIIGTGNDIVIDHYNGIIVQPNDALKLAAALQYLLENNNIRKKYSENGRRFIFDNFSSEKIIKNLCIIYEELS
jgi:glycosyltransferase involved in cell wall biosynthesis